MWATGSIAYWEWSDHAHHNCMRRLGKVHNAFSTSACNRVNSEKYFRCVVRFLTFCPRYSIELKSGEDAGSCTLVKRAAWAVQNCVLALPKV